MDTIPKRARVIHPGDCLFALGRPETLRKLKATNGVQSADTNVEAVATEAVDWDIPTTDGDLIQRGGPKN